MVSPEQPVVLSLNSMLLPAAAAAPSGCGPCSRPAAPRSAEAEARLQQSEKLKAIGQLTGGIAHDFKHPAQLAARPPKNDDGSYSPATRCVLASSDSTPGGAEAANKPPKLLGFMLSAMAEGITMVMPRSFVAS